MNLTFSVKVLKINGAVSLVYRILVSIIITKQTVRWQKSTFTSKHQILLQEIITVT